MRPTATQHNPEPARVLLRNMCTFDKSIFLSQKTKAKGTMSPPERCDFTSSEQYNNNVVNLDPRAFAVRR